MAEGYFIEQTTMNMEILKVLFDNFSLKNEKEKIETVIESIDRGVVFKGTNLWILVFAIFIASLGLNVNSTAVIIGAMLVSPLMGPIMGMGLSLGISDLVLLKKAVRNYVFATLVGLLTSTIYFSISPLNDAHSEILARTQPNIYDVLIALFGGLAGILAISSKQKGNVITGVAIATALMPPLCTAGFGLATLNFTYFFGALYLFLINTVFIAFATLITVRVLHFPQKHLTDLKAELKTKRVITSIVLLTLIPSIYFGYDTINQTHFKDEAQKFIENECKIENNYLLSKNIDAASKSILLVYGGSTIDESEKEKIKKKLKTYGLNGVRLIIQQGFAYETPASETVDKNHLSETLIGLENENKRLRAKLDSMIIDKLLGFQVLSESKVLFPEIISIIIQPSTEYSSNSSQQVSIAVIKINGKLTKENEKTLKNWLMTRLKLNNLRLLIEH